MNGFNSVLDTAEEIMGGSADGYKKIAWMKHGETKRPNVGRRGEKHLRYK